MSWKSECEEKMTIEAIAGAVSVEQRRRREAREERPTRARKRDRIKKFVSAVFSGRNNNSNSNDDGDDSLLPAYVKVAGDGSASTVERIWQTRRENLEKCLRQQVCSRTKLREIVADGFVPDQPLSVRYEVWSLLLGVVPENKKERAKEREKKRKIYEEYAFEFAKFLRTPDVSVEVLYRNEQTVSVKLKVKEKMKREDKDLDVLEQIERDVERLHPSLHFFNDEGENIDKKRLDMTEALFIFAKTNKGYSYVQGMHELLAPLYFVCYNHPNELIARDCKSDSFWMFVELISELRDAYCKELDRTDQGINHLLSEHDSLLRKRCPLVAAKLIDELNVKPQFYAFRWCVLMFAGEFDFPSVLRTFDFLVSWPRGKRDALLRMMSAMVHSTIISDKIMDEETDFAIAMKTLQNYPSCDVNQIIKIACSFPFDIV